MPRNSEGVSDPCHAGQVIVVGATDQRRVTFRLRPEYHKVVNPLENRANIVCTKDLNAGIGGHALDAACRGKSFNSIVLHIYFISQAYCQVLLVFQDNG